MDMKLVGFQMNYLDTPRNNRIAEIIKNEGDCGEVLVLYDVLEFAKDCFSVICMTTEGPLWGIIIIDGHLYLSSGTGLTAAGDFLAEYIRTDGDTEQ